MIKIEDVAREAGVSVATVSRVLNNSSSVRKSTADRVNQTIDQLSYVPNLSARNLRRNESKVILILVPNLTNPFYSHIISGICDTSRKIGYSSFICNTSGDPLQEDSAIEMLKHKRADGAILLSCNFDYERLKKYAGKYPIVQCCEYDEEIENIPYLAVDNHNAAYESVNYLISLGHKNIATISSTLNCISTVLRLKGYKEALNDAGIEFKDEYVECADAEYTFSSGYNAALKLLKNKIRPTAIFCISDILALSTIAAANSLGLSVPEDLSVMGFDDVDYTKMIHPYITTISQPCYELGKESVSLLQQCILKDGKVPKENFTPYKMKIRESTSALIN